MYVPDNKEITIGGIYLAKGRPGILTFVASKVKCSMFLVVIFY
jgi:hypothetical protein